MYLTHFDLVCLNDDNFGVVAWGLGDVGDNAKGCPLQKSCQRRPWPAWTLCPAESLGPHMSGPGVGWAQEHWGWPTAPEGEDVDVYLKG